MAKIYFTLTGTKHYYGLDFLESGMSAGRLYDRMDDKAKAKIILVTQRGALCKLCRNKKKKGKKKQLLEENIENPVKEDLVTEERILEALREIDL